MSVIEASLSQGPDWVSMDIEKLGKSFYNSDDQPLNEHIRSLKAKVLREALQKREKAKDQPKQPQQDIEEVARIPSSEVGNEPESAVPDTDTLSVDNTYLEEYTDDWNSTLESEKDIVLKEEAPVEEETEPEIEETEEEVKEEVEEQPKEVEAKVPVVSADSDDIFFEYSRTTEGLVNSTLRSQIWPILLSLEEEAIPAKPSKLNSLSASLFLDDLNSTDLPPHKDEDQVKLDIQRSFTVLTHIQSLNHQSQNESYTTIFSRSDIDELKKKLQHLVVKILRKYPTFHYYQGFHDIASIVLLVCHEPSEDMTGSILIDESLAFKMLDRLTVFHLRDFMISDINLSINHLKLIPTLLEVVDPPLFELIKQSSNSYVLSDGLRYDYNFYQGLSSILTFFSHDITSLQHILIIWDFILSYNSVLVSVYIYVASLVFYKAEIFKKLDHNPATNSSVNVDSDLVHTLISPAKLFDGLTDQQLIKILNKTKVLIESYPIPELENSPSTYDVWFKTFNKHSVLMNTSCLYTDRKVKSEQFKELLKPGSTPDSRQSEYNSPKSSGTNTPSNGITTPIDTLPNSVLDLILVQDEEMASQTISDLAAEHKFLQQQEELESSVHTNNTAFEDSLNSSSTSINSSDSSFNSTIVNTSSLILKKIFMSETPTPDDSKKHNAVYHFNNIYKISFTIGFVGFLIHFLVARNNSNYNSAILRIIGPPIDSFKRFLNHDVIAVINRELQGLSQGVANEVGVVFRDVFNFVKNSEVVNNGIHVGQIGLGNLRTTIYGFIPTTY